jgi:hypothetical protein
LPNAISLLLMLATAFSGILAGASLDQSIKQLPARHQIGVKAYSNYAQASDLKNGVLWYTVIGIGAALLTVICAIILLTQGTALAKAAPSYVAAILCILHTLATTQAAPTMFSQRRYQNDEAALTQVFNRFERWQTVRAVLQMLAFIAILWGLFTFLST